MRIVVLSHQSIPNTQSHLPVWSSGDDATLSGIEGEQSGANKPSGDVSCVDFGFWIWHGFGLGFGMSREHLVVRGHPQAMPVNQYSIPGITSSRVRFLTHEEVRRIPAK